MSSSAGLVRADVEVVLRIDGEMDIASVGELRSAFDLALRVAGGPLVLDCGGLTFIDAAGLGGLVACATAALGVARPVSLRNVSDSMQHLLELTHVDRCFPPPVDLILS